ncbi:MAG: hypothetical protein ACPG8W_02710 [Candidatus Promineifilaceae bacterium]
MISEPERAFVHQLTIGNLKGCEDAIRSLYKIVKKLHKEGGFIRGYRLYVVTNQVKLEAKFVDWCNYKKVTKGIFPFVYAGIQPFDENPQSFEELMLPLGFIACEQKPIDMDEVYASPFYEDLMSRPSSDD